MEYISHHTQIHEHNLIFKMPIKNQNPRFIHYYKLIYSNDQLNLKYLLIYLKFTKYNLLYDKINYRLVVDKADPFFMELKKIEHLILSALNNTVCKKIQYSLYNDFINKEYIYSFSSVPDLNHLHLKISGIWESEYCIGIVYKLCYNTSTENLSNIIC